MNINERILTKQIETRVNNCTAPLGVTREQHTHRTCTPPLNKEKMQQQNYRIDFYDIKNNICAIS